MYHLERHMCHHFAYQKAIITKKELLSERNLMKNIGYPQEQLAFIADAINEIILSR
jgi:hypothetical protein